MATAQGVRVERLSENGLCLLFGKAPGPRVWLYYNTDADVCPQYSELLAVKIHEPGQVADWWRTDDIGGLLGIGGIMYEPGMSRAAVVSPEQLAALATAAVLDTAALPS